MPAPRSILPVNPNESEAGLSLETVEAIQGVAVIVLTVSASALCVALTVTLAALFPRLRRIAFNLEQTSESTGQTAANTAAISQSLADRSGEIADNLERTTASAAQTAANTAVISQAIADRSGEIADNLSQAAGNFNAASADAAQTMTNMASASQLLGPVGAVANFAAAARGHVPGIINAAKSALEDDGAIGKIKNPGIRRAVESVLGNFRRNP